MNHKIGLAALSIIIAFVALGTTPAHAQLEVETSFEAPAPRTQRVEQPVALAAPARTVHSTVTAPKAERRQRRWFRVGK